VAGRLWPMPHMNRAGPRVVQCGHGRSSDGFVALVLPLVPAVASVMRVSVPLLPTAYSWRGRITSRRRGHGTLSDKGRGGGVGRVARHLHLQ
jgi:hypothetical protein